MSQTVERMMDKLFGRVRAPARVPEGLRVYAVGDIHGCSDLLDALTAAIRADEAGATLRSQLIFLGDYVDRGPDSKGVLDRLIALRRERPETTFLKGNHEAAVLDFLRDPEANAQLFNWGGAETVQSYGVDLAVRRPVAEVADEFRARLPATHLQFLEGLELTKTIGDYLFVHAGVRPGIAIDAQDEQDLLWIRAEFHNAPADKRPDKVVVHGHQPVRKPVDAGWRIDVDTGACFTGRLTAVVLEADSRRFLST
jgi:serine/threonine protein phosphatase 1